MSAAHRFRYLAVVTALALTPALSQAQLNTMTAQYFKVQNNGTLNPDFQSGIDGGIVPGLVQTTLSAGGLPMVSLAGQTHATGSGPIEQYDHTTSELLWWTPNGSSILSDGGGTVAVPFSGMDHGFFPTLQTNNDSWFRTAIFTGMINVTNPTSYAVTLGSDDDSWLFIDGNLVADDGGVKANNPTVFNTGILGGGSHTVQLFFADRNTVESGITFDPTFTVTATPEPSSLSLLATGFVGLAGVVRRRAKKYLA